MLRLFIALALLVAVAKAQDDPISCNSIIKLRHKSSDYLLHSHKITWGSGSHQQSVTATPRKDDPNSLWVVKEGQGVLACSPGEPIACGSVIRLEHGSTGKNLHTHHYKSPLSGQQEVSGFGENGEGDSGDNFVVECRGKSWLRGEEVRLKHVDTSAYLHSHGSHRFTQKNCPNCPIINQQEVTSFSKAETNNLWVVMQGMFFSDADE